MCHSGHVLGPATELFKKSQFEKVWKISDLFEYKEAMTVFLTIFFEVLSVKQMKVSIISI